MERRELGQGGGEFQEGGGVSGPVIACAAKAAVADFVRTRYPSTVTFVPTAARVNKWTMS